MTTIPAKQPVQSLQDIISVGLASASSNVQADAQKVQDDLRNLEHRPNVTSSQQTFATDLENLFQEEKGAPLSAQDISNLQSWVVSTLTSDGVASDAISAVAALLSPSGNTASSGP